MQNNDVILEVRDLRKEFPVKKRKLYAVSGVSFDVRRGETLGLVGESGCGKSTIAKMVAGSLPVTSGSIKLNGVDYTKLKPREIRPLRRNIQMVFQDPLSSFSPRMKIGTYICEPRINYDKVSRDTAMKEAEALLEKVGLPAEFIDRFPHELSGGQLQRMEIARALTIDPSIIILDEATSALDAQTEAEVIQHIRERGITCIVVAHRLSTIRDCDEIIVLDYGKVVERGTHAELMARNGAYAELVRND